MSDATENEGNMDFSKMKVNDLKKLLKSRGLSVAGVKQDLIDRLQSSEAAAEALLEGSEVGEDGFDEELDKELDESSLMADEEHTDEIPVCENTKKKDRKENDEESKPIEEPAAPASPKQVEESKEPNKTEVKQNGAAVVESGASKQIKVSLKPQHGVLSETDKKKARAERFGTAQKDQVSAMAKRAERFSLNKNSTSKPADSSTGQIKVTSTTTNEVLKRRAERFGILSPAEIKRQHLEKLQARKIRFQQNATVVSSTPQKMSVVATTASTVSTSTTSSSSTPTPTTTTNGTKLATSLSLEERKRIRAERFKIKT